MVFASVPVQGRTGTIKKLKMRNDARKGSVEVVKRRSELEPATEPGIAAGKPRIKAEMAAIIRLQAIAQTHLGASPAARNAGKWG